MGQRRELPVAWPAAAGPVPEVLQRTRGAGNAPAQRLADAPWSSPRITFIASAGASLVTLIHVEAIHL
jgi:hypothetical protein